MDSFVLVHGLLCIVAAAMLGGLGGFVLAIVWFFDGVTLRVEVRPPDVGRRLVSDPGRLSVLYVQNRTPGAGLKRDGTWKPS